MTISRIAIISTAIGLTSILVAFMIMEGFRKEIRDKIYSFNGHLLVTKYVLLSSVDDQPVSLKSDFYQNWQQEFPYVSHVQQFANKAGLLKTDEEVQGVILKGLGKDFNQEGFSQHIIEGKFPELKEKGYSLEVLLSKKLANQLLLETGDDVLMYFVQNPPRYRKLKVSGIYETGFEELDDKIIIGDINLIRRINQWPDSLTGGFEVFVKDITQLDQYRDDMFERIDHDLYVDLISDKYIQIFDWLQLIDRNVYIYLVIILVVASFNMVSILLILIMERVQMIGMLKAMGSDNRLIRKIFYYNGFRLILKGMVIANVLALGFAYLQTKFQIIPLDPKNYYMEFVPVVVNPLAVIGLNLLTLVFVGLALGIPIAIFSGIKPIKSIRFN